MNKRVFYLIIIVLILVSLINLKIYFNTKKELLNENNHLVLLESKIKKIYALKQKYKFKSYSFNRLKKFCKIIDKGEKYSLNCKKLNSNKFNRVQNIIFKNNFKIDNFLIIKNKSANLKVEIDK